MQYAATLKNREVLSLHKTIAAARLAAQKNDAEYIRPAERAQPPENSSDECDEIIYTDYLGWSLRIDIGNSGAFVSGF